MIYWTLLVYITLYGGEQIVIEGFTKMDDCLAMGWMNVEYVQRNNPKVKYQCTRSNIPPVRCLPDTRTYGRTGECITGREK